MAIMSMGIQVKLRVIANLAQHIFNGNKLGKEIENLVADIQCFDKFRNDVVHGLWVHYPIGTDKPALLRRKSLEQKVNPHPDGNVMKELPLKIAKLTKIQNETQRITVAIKALRGKFS